ncbi:hypothetical protein Dxin01_03557 [Deinococcus xinjiangensis]|uniref:Uncharacterized protein n=1 Tax=Deinococcus xinjiangensis TaxID=457454 RepID=A0ABP9VEZ3_9DEIO
MSEEIKIKQTLPMRARPDVLYRLALEPSRRVKWDANYVSAAYEGENTRLSNNALVNFKFARNLLGLRFQAKYGQLQAPLRGGWETVKPFGPIEKMTQGWNFKAMPGGTEVTLTLNARVRYKWLRPQLERILNNMVISTLMNLQKQVDVSGAQAMEDMGRELAEKQKADEKAAKAAAKAAKRKK